MTLTVTLMRTGDCAVSHSDWSHITHHISFIILQVMKLLCWFLLCSLLANEVCRAADEPDDLSAEEMQALIDLEEREAEETEQNAKALAESLTEVQRAELWAQGIPPSTLPIAETPSKFWLTHAFCSCDYFSVFYLIHFLSVDLPPSIPLSRPHSLPLSILPFVPPSLGHVHAVGHNGWMEIPTEHPARQMGHDKMAVHHQEAKLMTREARLSKSWRSERSSKHSKSLANRQRNGPLNQDYLPHLRS
jgi:hypothetical protein